MGTMLKDGIGITVIKESEHSEHSGQVCEHHYLMNTTNEMHKHHGQTYVSSQHQQ